MLFNISCYVLTNEKNLLSFYLMITLFISSFYKIILRIYHAFQSILDSFLSISIVFQTIVIHIYIRRCLTYSNISHNVAISV